MANEVMVEIWEPVAGADTKNALPVFGRARVQVTEVSASVLSSNLKQLLTDFQLILDEQPKKSSGYYIDEVELSLGVNGKGSFAIIAGIEAGAQASIKLKLKKASS